MQVVLGSVLRLTRLNGTSYGLYSATKQISDSIIGVSAVYGPERGILDLCAEKIAIADEDPAFVSIAVVGWARMYASEEAKVLRHILGTGMDVPADPSTEPVERAVVSVTTTGCRIVSWGQQQTRMFALAPNTLVTATPHRFTVPVETRRGTASQPSAIRVREDGTHEATIGHPGVRLLPSRWKLLPSPLRLVATDDPPQGIAIVRSASANTKQADVRPGCVMV